MARVQRLASPFCGVHREVLLWGVMPPRQARGQPLHPIYPLYVKSRGVRTDAYLALIKPFRHTIVYPAWIRRITDEWNRPVRSRRS
jgi:hypothetical protein